MWGLRREVERKVELRSISEKWGIEIEKKESIDIGWDGLNKDGEDWMRRRCGLMEWGRWGDELGMNWRYEKRMVEGIKGLRGKIKSEKKGSKRKKESKEKNEEMMNVMICIFNEISKIEENLYGVKKWNGESFKDIWE